jgi:hypothetical protein
VHDVPGPQSRVVEHKSMQWPSSHVPLRQSPSLPQVSPPGRPEFSATQLATTVSLAAVAEDSI